MILRWQANVVASASIYPPLDLQELRLHRHPGFHPAVLGRPKSLVDHACLELNYALLVTILRLQ